jgi:hypothetical protein
MKNSTTNTITETKDQIIERLQEELKKERSFCSDAPKRPVIREDIFKDILDLSDKQLETKSDFASFRRSRSIVETSYSLPTAEAIPVIDGDAVRQDGVAIQELQKENLRLQAQLTAAAKERETFVFLQEENKRLQTEILRLHQIVEKKNYTANQISKKYMDLYFQYKQEKEARETLLRTEIQPAILAIEEKINCMSEIATENGNLLLNPKAKPFCEDKAVQAFSESEIAQAMLKSQPKRLRYLK